jgi:uncharacterized membrane protein
MPKIKKRFWKNVSNVKNNDHVSHSKRFWEIDALRGIAIALMIIFHAVFDLVYFGVYNPEITGFNNLGWLFWFVFPRAIASIFIVLVGVSATLSYNRSAGFEKKYVSRGIRIFFLGMLITLITALLPKGTILFGILHFIGVSTILSMPFVKMRRENLLLGISIILAGAYLQTMRFDFPWLLWLGLMPKNFYTLDYFPLLPWFGFTLMGIFVGNNLYPKAKRNFKIADLSERTRLLCFLGRNSLLIYLAHQPVIMLILYLSGAKLF